VVRKDDLSGSGKHAGVTRSGAHLTLTPAYDIAPTPRSTPVASQAIGITRDGRRSSQLRLCLEAAGDFLLRPAEARATVDRLRGVVADEWAEACDEARLTTAQRTELWGREFANPYMDDDEA
jgi:serine/threonine-protein kinase HipA